MKYSVGDGAKLIVIIDVNNAVKSVVAHVANNVVRHVLQYVRGTGFGVRGQSRENCVNISSHVLIMMKQKV